jgi:phosphoenolpyruvate phosphomutase
MSASIRSLLGQNNGKVHLLEAHDFNSRDVVRNAVGDDGQSFQGVWISGLTQTTYLGVPDTELISPLKRASLMAGFNDNPQQNNCRPLCAVYDADSGGDIADVPALVALLATKGISMIIIEDKSVLKPGEKVNSLKETSGLQSQADMYEFAKTIRAFKSLPAQKEMMITARIESFTVRIVKKDNAEEKISIQNALQDALLRAEVYKNAGADAIMIHSKSDIPDEVLSFLTDYRTKDPVTPLVVVPTTYSKTNENILYDAGANIIIYANHLMRAKIYALKEFFENLLEEKPDFISQDVELSGCLDAHNFGCLLRKMLTINLNNISKEAKQYQIIMEKQATEYMNAAAKCLLDGKMSCSADAHIISVKELLKINASQVTIIKELTEE